MTNYLRKKKELILYLIFGILTTLVNWGIYYLCADVLHWGTVSSTIIAWFLSVAFAFVTNKLLVFESKKRTITGILYESLSFLGCRLFSGILDLGIMWICVDFFHWNDMVMKIISNIIVVILNYGFSKLIIFRKKVDSKKIQTALDTYQPKHNHKSH